MVNTKVKRHVGLRTSKVISNTIIYIILGIITVIWLVPFALIILDSLEVGVNENGTKITWMTGDILPTKFGFDNYVDLWTKTDFPTWFLSTFIAALATCVIQTVIVLCMSYTLSRLRFNGRKALMNFMLILGMFPGMLTLIILYRVLADLGMTGANSLPGLILVYVASSGMGYYVSKGFFDTIPKSLDEAAKVDGCNNLQILYKVILPLAKPIVIYTILTAFMGPWGDFVFAKLIAHNTTSGMNVAVGLNTWLSKSNINTNYRLFCAGGVCVALPVAALFIWLQKYYVEGVTGGAVKG